MAFKQFQLDELGTITVYKRRGTNSLRLSVRPDGSLRVTIPAWSAYATGVQFARSRRQWIEKHRSAQPLPGRQFLGECGVLPLRWERKAAMKISARCPAAFE